MHCSSSNTMHHAYHSSMHLNSEYLNFNQIKNNDLIDYRDTKKMQTIWMQLMDQ